MFCKKCKQEIPEGSAFCNLCGSSQLRQKSTRAKNGAGAYYKRKDGTVEYKVSLGIRGDGTANRKSFYGRTEKDCRKKYEAWKTAEFEVPIERVETVAQWADKWLELYKKGKIGYGAYRNYEGYVNNHIKPKLGALKLSQVRQAHIEEFRKTISHLSDSAKNQIHLALSGIFKTAVANKFCVTNPMPEKEKKKNPQEEIQVFAPKEIEIILNSAHEYAYLLKIMLYTGMRMGEVLALKWTDIDVENRIIYLSSSLARKEGGGYAEKGPKSDKPRTVAVNDKTITFFNALPKVGIFVAMNIEKNRQLTPKAFEIRYNKFFESTGIPYLSSHKCRHTYATYLVKGGADLSAVQALLGHSSVTVTEKYTHVSGDTSYLKDNVAMLDFKEMS